MPHSDDGPGRNVTKAFRVAVETCHHSSQFFAYLDRAFSKRKLYPSRSKTVGENVAARIGSAERWIPTTLYRAYTSASDKLSKARQERLLAIEIDFALEEWEEPVLVVAAIRPSGGITPKDIWSAWRQGLAKAIAIEPIDGKPREVASQDIAPSFAGAAKCVLFTLPLCNVTDSTIDAIVVNPAVTMLKAV